MANDFSPTWINPLNPRIITFSDGFSSLFFLRIAFYTRLIWLAFSVGFWIFSLLCIRRYQSNLLYSYWLNLELTLPGNMIPVVNHRLINDYIWLNNGSRLWMATIEDFGLRINAGDYIVESFIAAGMDVDFIFSRNYQQIMYEHDIPGAIAEVLDFFTERLGPLHWAHLPSLSMLQSSALMMGGIAGDGFVEWGESIFPVSNLDNPLHGTNAAEIFVHEMVHMWWGGLGVFSGNPGWGSDNELWSDEGLTVYYTYRFFKHKYGEENVRHIVDACDAVYVDS